MSPGPAKQPLLTTQEKNNVKSMLLHLSTVFLTTFAGQLTVSSVGAAHESWSTAMVLSAVVSGVVASVHYVAGLVPSAK